MRKIIALLMAGLCASVVQSSSANAADMPLKAPAPMAQAPVWSWTGFYIGAHVGGAWGTIESEFTEVPFPIASGTVNGFLGGGQIGYNIQSGFLVFGIEADGSWASIKGTTPCLFILSCTREVNSLGTITGRLGFTADRALVYVKGGAAWARFEYDVRIFGTSVATARENDWGYTVGTGIEYAITSNWSAKVEYNFMDFGKRTTAFNIDFDDIGTVDVDTTRYLHAVKFGLNYRFGGGPLMARN